ncbi:MAG: FlgD immunoglobulin-like domain containing protein [Ignavibacteriaceae bacterium]
MTEWAGNYQFEIYPNTSLLYPITSIFLNNRFDFIYEWTTEESNLGSAYVPFKAVILHELGHLIGLGHNYDPELQTVMQHTTPHNTYLFTLTSSDIQGLQELCLFNGTPTGIEDEILITLSTSHFNVNQTYAGANNRIFIDHFPYGDYIVEWGPWQIKASYGCGEILVFETNNNGYINIPSLPNGYLWERDLNGYVKATIITSGLDNTGHTHYASQSITIGNVPNTFITSGTLNANTVWCGNITITGNITVPVGKTLIIYPNANITFSNNASLIVYGTLNATGCELNGGGNTWGSVTFDGNSSSNSVLNHVTLKKASEVRCVNNANVLINYSYFDYCHQGVYIYNSQPKIVGNLIIDTYGNGIYGESNGKAPLIKDNVIKKITRNLNNYQGIYLLNFTNPFITGNDIKGFQHGIYYAGGGNGICTNNYYATPSRNNRLTGNRYGLTVAWGSYLLAGGDYIPQDKGINYIAHKNSIWGNTYSDAYAYQSATIIGKQNWWGTNPSFSTASNGFIDSSEPISYDPWDGIPLRSEEDIYTSILLEGYPNIFEDILTGIDLEANENIPQAVSHYKNMIRKTSHPKFALTRLAGIKKKFSLNDIQQYLETLLGSNASYKTAALNLVAGMYLDDDRYEEAMQLYNIIINQYPESYDATNALFEKFFAALHVANNVTLASQFLSELQSLNITDEDFLMRLDLAESVLNGTSSNGLFKGGTAESKENETNLPKEYSLLGNYPNPFNPSTTISYALPYQSSVELIVYDIMGAKVKSFTIPSQSAGYQNILWDGRNENGNAVSSGVYIYRFNIKSLENNQAFVKSAKLMLMK